MSQSSHWQTLTRQDGEVLYLPHAWSASRAQALFEILQAEIPWQSEHYTIYGKTVEAPRRVAWYGDPGTVYRYSGIRHQPLPWSDTLRDIKQRVETLCGHTYNSVLANLYRDGQDSMGWHADKEPELGPNPVIASVTLGAERVFKIRHNKSKQVIDIPLVSGSLLLMRGEFQYHWKHSVPKTRRPLAPRINLTYRYIQADREEG